MFPDIPLYIIGGISAAIVLTSSVLFDKLIVVDRAADDRIILAASGSLAAFFLLPLFLFTSPDPTSYAVILAFAVVGAGNFLGGFFYLRAVRVGDPSVLAVVWRFEPLFVLVMATAFLGERFTVETYVGLFLLFVAVFSVLLQRHSGGLQLSAGAGYAIAGALLYSLLSIGLRHLFTTTGVSGWTGFLWSRVGAFVVFALYFVYLLGTSPTFIKTVRSLSPRDVSMLSGRMFLIEVGAALIVVSISLGPVSIVSALLAVQTILIVVAATVIDKIPSLSPKLGATPEISTATKLIAASVAVLGVYLVS